MAHCVPVRELKDTAKFLSVVEGSKDPVTVTRNGRDVMQRLRRNVARRRRPNQPRASST